MKIILFTAFVLLAAPCIQAQQKAGKVTYDRTSQIQINFQGMPGMEQQMPRTRTDKFELLFANNQTLWKQAEQEPEDENHGMGEGMQIRMVIAGSNDVLFTDLDTKKRVEKRELFEKSFIIDDTVSALKWKMTGETKTILGLPCMKATAVTVRTRTMTMMDNGKMERKETQDTANVVAWFTNSVPVSAGPAEYQGQLPGLILEMDIRDGQQVFKATSITEKIDLSVIREPAGKKRLTAAEFRKERDKMMEEMNRNNQGGQRMIRMN